MIARLWKPWFVYRPAQLLHRVAVAVRPKASGYQPLSTSWGTTVLADPTKNIGISIMTTGVYDLAVSEALARLVVPGDLVIDGGANVGYMSALLSVATGSGGTLLSFEPHPELFGLLRRNVAALGAHQRPRQTELHNAALGEAAGTARLAMPSGFSENDGISHVTTDAGNEEASLPIVVETIDDSLGTRVAGVMKLDVEGYELHALRGATRALTEHRIRHIVFEDHTGPTSAVVQFLEAFGYRIFSLGWSMRGPSLAPIAAGRLASDYEPANYVATVDPEGVKSRMRERGWVVLGRRVGAARTA